MSDLETKNSIKSFLLENGYKVEDHNNYLKTNAIFRGGSDISSITIYPRDLLVIDHVTSEKYSVNKFLSLVLNVDENKISEDKRFNFTTQESVAELEQPKIFDPNLLGELLPIYDYWNGRAVSNETLIKLKSGLYNGTKGSLKNRYIFPIFNSKGHIIGINGRDISNTNKIKWIIKGQKANFCYPAFYNSKIIQESGAVWLVESVGDLLALFSCGIENVLVLFGTELNLAIINYLLKINIKKIYISTNDDSLKNNAGNDAAHKIQKRLQKYFRYDTIKIVLPKKENDWSDILQKNGKQEILEQLKNYI